MPAKPPDAALVPCPHCHGSGRVAKRQDEPRGDDEDYAGPHPHDACLACGQKLGTHKVRKVDGGLQVLLCLRPATPAPAPPNTARGPLVGFGRP